MRTRRKHIALFAALVLLFSLCTAILAHDVPDLTRDDCTISLTMRYQGKAVPGGSITLYRVATVYEYDGNYTFRQISVSYKYWRNVLKRSENKSKIHFGLAKS